MNDVISQLHARVSVRAYTDEPVSPDDERAILEAAGQAPTAGNQQLYSIVVVRDQALKDRLAVTCDNQPFIARAPLVLAFCVDVRRWHRAFVAAGCEPRDPGVGDFVLACQDALIAAQNAVTAAWSLGIGSCYIGDVLERGREQAEILGCPRHVVPVTLLVLGHPAPAQLERRKPRRFALEDFVFENRYEDAGDDRLVALVGEKTGASPDDRAACEGSVRAFCARKWDSGFSREMTRSVAESLATFDWEPAIAAEPAAEAAVAAVPEA